VFALLAGIVDQVEAALVELSDVDVLPAVEPVVGLGLFVLDEE